jgi:hypothetical protein
MSSLVMMPLPSSSEIVAPLGDDSFTKKVSSGSRATSPVTLTVTLLVVSSGPKLTVVTATATKSLSAVAVPPSVVAYRTDEDPVVSPDRLSVNVAGVLPEFASLTVTSVTARNVEGPGWIVTSSLTMVTVA